MTKIQWKVKDFSLLTGVSVRTLHHYDEIRLLQPSTRAENGYRLYTQENLLKLQQIVTLKFLGFNLTQIKGFLQKRIDPKKLLLQQALCIEEKIHHLKQGNELVKLAIEQYNEKQNLNWQLMSQLIKEFNMEQNFKIKMDFINKSMETEQKFFLENQGKVAPIAQASLALFEELEKTSHIDAGSIEAKAKVEQFLNQIQVYATQLEDFFTKVHEFQQNNNPASFVKIQQTASDWITQACKIHNIQLPDFTNPTVQDEPEETTGALINPSELIARILACKDECNLNSPEAQRLALEWRQCLLHKAKMHRQALTNNQSQTNQNSAQTPKSVNQFATTWQWIEQTCLAHQIRIPNLDTLKGMIYGAKIGNSAGKQIAQDHLEGKHEK